MESTIELEKDKEIDNNFYFTESEIKNIIQTMNQNEIADKYPKKELDNMYISIFATKPLSKMKKNDIVYSLWHYFHSIDRAAAFSSLL